MSSSSKDKAPRKPPLQEDEVIRRTRLQQTGTKTPIRPNNPVTSPQQPNIPITPPHQQNTQQTITPQPTILQSVSDYQKLVNKSTSTTTNHLFNEFFDRTYNNYLKRVRPKFQQYEYDRYLKALEQVIGEVQKSNDKFESLLQYRRSHLQPQNSTDDNIIGCLLFNLECLTMREINKKAKDLNYVRDMPSLSSKKKEEKTIITANLNTGTGTVVNVPGLPNLTFADLANFFGSGILTMSFFTKNIILVHHSDPNIIARLRIFTEGKNKSTGLIIYGIGTKML